MPQVVDVRDYRNLYRKTREAGPEIRKDFRKRLRVAGRIGADAAKLRIRAWPVHGGITFRSHRGSPRGLRATLASNIRVSVGSRDVTIRQGAGGLHGNSAADLPRDIDRGGWYHPTYGHRPKVFQAGFPYFKKEIAGKRDAMLAEVSQVLDDITKRLT